MKSICPKCHYTGMFDAAASVSSFPSGLTCPRCGEALAPLPWSGAQTPKLTTAAAAVAPQLIMENQNAYAPSAEPVFEDVLDIPSPLRSTEPKAEHHPILEDVISADDLSIPEESFEAHVEGTDTDEATLLRTQPGGYVLAGDGASLAGEKSTPTDARLYRASEAVPADHSNGRTWLRFAPLLLLIGALVFFALYFLGNRMGRLGSNPQEVAAVPAQPETQSAAPAAATAKAEQNATAAAPPEASTAATAKEEAQAPVAQPSPRAAKAESKPTAAEPAAVPAPSPASPAPVAQHSAGNFTVQVASYNNSAQADERAGRLRSSGVEARVVRAEIPRRGTWYRVQVGRFASSEEAARFASELKGKGATDTFIITQVQGQ